MMVDSMVSLSVGLSVELKDCERVVVLEMRLVVMKVDDSVLLTVLRTDYEKGVPMVVSTDEMMDDYLAGDLAVLLDASKDYHLDCPKAESSVYSKGIGMAGKTVDESVEMSVGGKVDGLVFEMVELTDDLKAEKLAEKLGKLLAM